MSIDTKLKPFLSRLDFSRNPSIYLNTKQAQSVSHYLKLMDDSFFTFESNPCLCGNNEDILIGQRDRFGFPLRTVLCRRCGLMRSDPYFILESLEIFYRVHYRPIYTGNLEIKDFYLKELHRGENILNWYNKNAALNPSSQVFEIGCGAGGILKVFQKEGHNIAGCDFDNEFLNFGRRKGLALETGGIDTLRKYGRADLIILRHVIEHFHNPLTELNKLYRLLKPTGKVYVELPGIFNIRKTYRDPLHFMQNAHVWHFCIKTLDYVMALSGFKRISGTEEIKSIYTFEDDSANLNKTPNNHIYLLILVALYYYNASRHIPRISDWKSVTNKIKRLFQIEGQALQ